MAAVPDCQIELCCPDCTSDEDAIAKGYGTVCAGSKGGLAQDQPAELRVQALYPTSAADFNSAAADIKTAVAEAAGVDVSLVQIVALKQALRVAVASLSSASARSESRRGSNLCDHRPTNPTPPMMQPMEAGRDKLDELPFGTVTGKPLPSSEEVSYFAVTVQTSAWMLDSTWALLTEDALNQKFAKYCLHPTVLQEAPDSTAAVDPALAGVGLGDCNEVCLSVIVTSCVLGVFGLCWLACGLHRCCSCNKGAVSDNVATDVWETYDWQCIPFQFKLHWEVLGYSERNWGSKPTGANPPPIESLGWMNLHGPQQASASALGYTQEMWDSDPRCGPTVLPVVPLLPDEYILKQAQYMPSCPYPPPAPLPRGWEELTDAATARNYYVNHLSHSTQWDRPV
jgi:hypothetical protein